VLIGYLTSNSSLSSPPASPDWVFSGGAGRRRLSPRSTVAGVPRESFFIVMFHHDGRHYTSVQYPDQRFLCPNWWLLLSFGTLREAQNEKPVCVRDYFIAGIGFVSDFSACAIASGHSN
jgi:hypothetical protein